jgi:hypothetical protein
MTISKNHRSSYYVDRITEDTVRIVDMDHGKSVTNDAENVVEELYKQYGNRRFIYLDTMGRWDELAHDNGKFTGFRPFNS